MTKKLILFAAVFFTTIMAHAAEPNDTLLDTRRPSHFHIGLEMQTKYVWRGQEMMVGESSPVVFTQLYYQYKGWRAYTKGGYAINGQFSQVNVGVDYSYKWLQVGLTDYYFPSYSLEDDYTNFDHGKTRHLLEASLGVVPTKFPLKLTVSTIVAGDDKYDSHEDHQAYSTYAEIGTWYEFLDDNRLSLDFGFCNDRSIYNDRSNFCNNVNIDFKYTYSLHLAHGRILPLSASYIINPVRDKAFVNFSMRYDF